MIIAINLVFIIRFHPTLKKQLQNRQTRFPQLLQILLDISLLREQDRCRKKLVASLRFPTGKLPPFLEMINSQYRPFAAKKIAEEFQTTTSDYSYTEVVAFICNIFSLKINVYSFISWKLVTSSLPPDLMITTMSQQPLLNARAHSPLNTGYLAGISSSLLNVKKPCWPYRQTLAGQ